jgi:transposase
VGIEVAQAAHGIHLRHAHTRIGVPSLTIPNTTRGFTQLWARIQQAQRTTGCREVVCGLEPPGTYHQALAASLETQGADVVLLSRSVAYWNRRTQDGTEDKHDRKDAVNCADLLEQGKILFYSQPTGPLAELRRLVTGLRRARAERAACKARWRPTLRPALAPAGDALPQRPWAELPAALQTWGRAARGRPALPEGRLPLGLATACADLGAQVTAVQARTRAIEATLTPLADRLPAYALLRSIPGIGPTVGATLVAEIGDVAWFTKFSQLRKLAGLDIIRVQTGQFAGQWRISKCGRGLLRWALYQAAGGRARLAALQATRRGDRCAGFKAMVEVAAKELRLVWGVWRSGQRYAPPGRVGLRRQRR